MTTPARPLRFRLVFALGAVLLLLAALASAAVFRDSRRLRAWRETPFVQRVASLWQEREVRRATRKPPRTVIAPTVPTAQRLSQPMLARIDLDLTYVDRNSTAYTRFKSWVDSAVAGNIGYAFEATDAAMMYQLTGSTAYCDLAIRLVEQQVSAAEAAITAGRNPEVAGDSYLEVGPMISDLAQTLDSCASRIPAQQQQRWSAYAEQTIWNVWNYGSARWGNRAAPWTGWSVDNPGNNYHYSFLTATAYWALTNGRHPAWFAPWGSGDWC